MTLIISVLTPTQVVQLADRRRTESGGKYVDADHKTVVFRNEIAFSTAGSDKVGATDGSYWLLHELHKLRDARVSQIVDPLVDRLNRVYSVSAAPDRMVGFFGAGWTAEGSESLPFYCSISNFQEAFDEPFRNTPSEHFYGLRVSPTAATCFVVAPPNLDGLSAINERLQEGLPAIDSSDREAISQLLLDCAASAEGDARVSRALLLYSIPKPGFGAPGQHYIPGDADPALDVSPWIVYPGLLQAPASVFTTPEAADAWFDTLPLPREPHAPQGLGEPSTGLIKVNIDNFARAESERFLVSLQAEAGGVNVLKHHRMPMLIYQQPVVRIDRDVLNSTAVVDISEGATITIPDAGDRYLAVAVVNQDHYVNRILHEPGKHALTLAEFDTPWVMVGVLLLVDPDNDSDVAAVNALQDGFALEAQSAKPFEMPDYDMGTLNHTRWALGELTKDLRGELERAFGTKAYVDPVRHLVATAASWGGVPDHEIAHIRVEPNRPVGEYKLIIQDVPCDGWSLSLYNSDGYFEPNDRNAYSVNSLTATPNDDGSVTVHFGGDDDRPNLLPIMDGWNYMVRLYRPGPKVLDGTWSFPSLDYA